MDVNEIIFCIQISLCVFFGMFFASRGRSWLLGWLSLLSIVMNIFVLKQVRLWGLEVTSADVYMVGMLTSLNYARELYDRESINEIMLGSWVITMAFLLMTHLHLALIPSKYDISQEHFLALFSPTLRLIVASLVTMMTVQVLDGRLFSWLQKICKYRYFGIRNAMTIAITQILDTVMFSYLGLYGIVAHLNEVIFLALLIKLSVVAISLPITVFGGYRKRALLNNHFAKFP